MKKAYLIHGVSRYNIVGKAALKNREKYYAVDMGFRTINTNTINFEDTFFLENIIYNELLTRGYNVFTGKTFKGEIDMSQNGIIHMNILDFLLHKKDLILT